MTLNIVLRSRHSRCGRAGRLLNTGKNIGQRHDRRDRRRRILRAFGAKIDQNAHVSIRARQPRDLRRRQRRGDDQSQSSHRQATARRCRGVDRRCSRRIHRTWRGDPRGRRGDPVASGREQLPWPACRYPATATCVAPGEVAANRTAVRPRPESDQVAGPNDARIGQQLMTELAQRWRSPGSSDANILNWCRTSVSPTIGESRPQITSSRCA